MGGICRCHNGHSRHDVSVVGHPLIDQRVAGGEPVQRRCASIDPLRQRQSLHRVRCQSHSRQSAYCDNDYNNDSGLTVLVISNHAGHFSKSTYESWNNERNVTTNDNDNDYNDYNDYNDSADSTRPTTITDHPPYHPLLERIVLKTTEVLKNPSMYIKAIVGFVVTVLGALITSGVLTGTAGKVAGAIITGAASFTAVFVAPNKKAPRPRKRRREPLAPRPIIDTNKLDELGAAMPFVVLVLLVVVFLVLGLTVAKLFLYVCLAFAVAAVIALALV